jgi:Ribbon-helix-helix protein, copG family
VEIHPSALKQGVLVEDLEHAVRNAIVSEDLDADLRLYLGPSRSAALVEVIAVTRGGDRPGVGDSRDADPRQVPTTPAGRVTMGKKDYGQTVGGEPITEKLVEKLAAKAEAGFDVDEILRRRGGRPAMGSSAASVESVRLDPELSEALRERAETEGRTNSELIRDALRRYLQAS